MNCQPRIALVPSERYAHLSTAICRECLWSTVGYCPPAFLSAEVDQHRAACTGSPPAGQTAARRGLNRLTLAAFDRAAGKGVD